MYLPSEVRKALGLKGAGRVVITVSDSQATLATMAANLERIRQLARPYAPKDGLASEELTAERREEAKRESAEPRAAAQRRGNTRRAGS
jgi:bifunctional DNA-binding transcriptional regulator/antitoxin component of YhaV-PrlF toxin-antitoxin module